MSEGIWRVWPGLQTIKTVTVAELASPERRVIVLAPHPDDEILMVGGLLQQLYAQGNPCLLIAATDGEASHPGSTIWPPELLRMVRPKESVDALLALNIPTIDITRLGLSDGGVSTASDVLQEFLIDIVKPGDIVFTTWAHDGHPDHQACGRTAAAAVAVRGARLIEVPVWMWHWTTPTDHRIPWHRARRLVLDADQAQRKHAAMSAFRSQLEVDESTGREAVVPPSMLTRILQKHEIFFL